MPPAAGVVSHFDQAPMVRPASAQPAPVLLSDASSSFAKDAVIAWFRGEFAAANAIIDSLCNHLAELHGGAGSGSVYESAFSAIHLRRLNWIPILQMQKYYPITDVVVELKAVAKGKKASSEEKVNNGGELSSGENDRIGEPKEKRRGIIEEEEIDQVVENGGEDEDNNHYSNADESPKNEIVNPGAGSKDVQPGCVNLELCSNNEDCEARQAHIKITKGFVAKEPVKGHMVNVVRGLKLYQDIFNDIELSELTSYVNELRASGQNGELSGETFIMYHQQVKGGNKRELIQLGAPIFGPVKKEATSQCPKSQIEPIPAPLQSVIDNLVQWHFISESRKPNSCIINFFDEEEYSQPFLKPPHLDQPISTLLLSESEMAFGRTLVCDNDGNYKGPLMLSLKKGSLLVMRGNSADMARHVMCPSPSKRISITFFRVRTGSNVKNSSTMPPLNSAMTLWQPGVPNGYSIQNGTYNGYEAMNVISKWSALRTPMFMFAPMRPIALNPKRIPGGGTGVFLPWTVGSKKTAKDLPPRAQKGRFLELPSPVETQKTEATSDANTSIEGKLV